jgi:hypothetical protein
MFSIGTRTAFSIIEKEIQTIAGKLKKNKRQDLVKSEMPVWPVPFKKDDRKIDGNAIQSGR